MTSVKKAKRNKEKIFYSPVEQKVYNMLIYIILSNLIFKKVGKKNHNYFL